MLALFHLEQPLPLGAFKLNVFNHLWKSQVSYVFPPPALIPLVLSKFLAEHITSKLRFLSLVSPCWMESIWLPTVLNMLEDVPVQCPIIKDFIMDVSVCWLLRGLPLLHLIFSCSDMCVVQTGVFSSVFQSVAGMTLASTTKVYQQCLK